MHAWKNVLMHVLIVITTYMYVCTHGSSVYSMRYNSLDTLRIINMYVYTNVTMFVTVKLWKYNKLPMK